MSVLNQRATCTRAEIGGNDRASPPHIHQVRLTKPVVSRTVVVTKIVMPP